MSFEIVHEWNGHLEIFSQVRKKILGKICFSWQKTIVGCPWPERWKTTIGQIAAHFLVHFLAVDLHDCKVKRPQNFLIFTFKGGNVTHVLVHFFHCSSFLFFSSAIKFVYVRWSSGNLDLFENCKGFNIIFPIDWPRSNSTISPIASVALLGGCGR